MNAASKDIEVRRLRSEDRELANSLFVVMAAVFEESSSRLSTDYVDELLRRDDFVTFAALADGQPVGGLTAFVLPLTRAQASELLIYDLAVQREFQRRGLGRRLVEAALDEAAKENLVVTWVPAANEDADALDFYRAIGGRPTATTIFTFGDRE